MAGDSPTISFTVKSHPPFAKEPVHKVYKKKDCSSFFNLLDGHNNIITFHDVKVSDSGLWVIQCTNPNGLSGEKSFKLKVYFPGKCHTNLTNQYLYSHACYTVDIIYFVTVYNYSDCQISYVAVTGIENEH